MTRDDQKKEDAGHEMQASPERPLLEANAKELPPRDRRSRMHE
jgi:hypothetical protein